MDDIRSALEGKIVSVETGQQGERRRERIEGLTGSILSHYHTMTNEQTAFPGPATGRSDQSRAGRHGRSTCTALQFC